MSRLNIKNIVWANHGRHKKLLVLLTGSFYKTDNKIN